MIEISVEVRLTEISVKIAEDQDNIDSSNLVIFFKKFVLFHYFQCYIFDFDIEISYKTQIIKNVYKNTKF